MGKLEGVKPSSSGWFEEIVSQVRVTKEFSTILYSLIGVTEHALLLEVYRLM